MNSYNFRTEENSFRPDDRLVIDCIDPSSHKLVKKLQKIPLARLDEVRLLNILEDHPGLVKSILNGLFPTKINNLELSSGEYIVHIIPFMDGFTGISRKVQTRVSLCGFCFSNQLRFVDPEKKPIINEYCLVNFFEAYKHVKAIKLSECI